MSPHPDVLISSDGQSAAFRGNDGRLSILHNGRDTFALKEWLAADADARIPKDSSLANGVRCDAIGCIGALKDGRLISMVFGIEAIAEDCARVAVVVSARELPGSGCAAIVIDRQTSRERGAVALQKAGDHFKFSFGRPPGSERPWMGGLVRASESAQSTTARSSNDAMPREDDLSADD
jgi:competence protein ComEC